MLSEKESLYQQILADPDNDLVRLVYADLIEEQGQQEYANFIRHQINHPKEPYPFLEFVKIRSNIVCPERFYTSFTGMSYPFCNFFCKTGYPISLLCEFSRGFPERIGFTASCWKEESSFCKSLCYGLWNTFFAQIVKLYPVRRFELFDIYSASVESRFLSFEYVFGPDLYSVLKTYVDMSSCTKEKVETAALELARKWALLTPENK